MSLLLDHTQPAPRTEEQTPEPSALPDVVYVTCVRWYNANVQYGLEFMEACRQRGHRVMVMAPKGYPVLAEAQRRGMETQSIQGSGLVAMIKGMRWIRRLPEKAILVSGCSRSMNFLMFLNDRHRHIRIRIDQRPIQGGRLAQWAYGRLDGLVIPAAGDPTGLAARLGLKVEGLFSHPGTADPSPLATPEQGRVLRQELGIAPDRFLVGLVARLDHVKGQRNAIEALAHCPNSRVHLLITGEPVNIKIEELQDFAARLGVGDRVTVIGRMSDPGPVFAACDAGLVASVGSEPQSRVLVEWAVHGKPVISTEVGMCASVGHRVGPTVPPGDPHALAGAMHSLSSKGLSQALAGTLADSRKLFSRKHWNEAVSQYLRHIAPAGFLMDWLDWLAMF